MSAAVTRMYGRLVLSLLASCQVILAPRFDDEDDELVGFEGLGKLFRESFRWKGMWSVENEGFGPLCGLKCYVPPDEAADLPDNCHAIIGDSCLLGIFYQPGLVGIITATAFNVVLEAWTPCGRCKFSANWEDTAGFYPEKMDVYHWQVADRSTDRRMYNGVGDMISRFEALFAHQNRLARRLADGLAD